MMGNIVETAGKAPMPAPEWEWVARAVWTDRMLNALHCGVQGGKWHNLIDKVFTQRNMTAAHNKVEKNRGAPGIDRITVERYRQNLEHNQTVLIDQLRKDALREVDVLMSSGYVHIVDADIKGFFDAIPKDILMKRVCEHISDGRVLRLIESFLKQGVMEDMDCWQPETGTPQGGVISPLLANIFLNAFDWFMLEHGVRIVRYADDFVLLCKTRQKAEKALDLAKKWISENRLTLHPEKTKLVDMTKEKAEFNFLGYRFKRHTNKKNQTSILKLVSRKSQDKVKSTLRIHTKRCNAHSLSEIIRRVNKTLQGWFNYFKHCHFTEMAGIDQFVRRRMRRILRKRSKRKGGIGRYASDHKRWPNTFFSKQGYLSLESARVCAVQSLRGTC